MELIGTYVPHWENAIVPAIIQVVILVVTWLVIFAYVRRWGARIAAVVLTFCLLASIGTGLAIKVAQLSAKTVNI